MPMYMFHLRRPNEAPTGLEAFELAHDDDAFSKAGRLLDEHRSCDHVEVWEGERAVVARHRDEPTIRTFDGSREPPAAFCDVRGLKVTLDARGIHGQSRNGGASGADRQEP